MKKLLAGAFSLVLLTVISIFGQANLSPAAVHAVDPNEAICSNLVDPSNPPAICTAGGATDPVTGKKGLFPTLIELVIFLTAAISVVMIIIGGFRYIISGGDSNGIQGAKNTIIYALVGLVIAVFSQTIVSVVLSKLK